MDASGFLLIAVVVFAWGLISARLERADLTAPIVFSTAGALLAAFGLLDAPDAPEAFRPLVEVTLVWVLFADAARIRDFRHDLSRYARLLGIGLPLTVLGGWALAVLLVDGIAGSAALLVGAALAPTDAALGVPVVTNPAVPSRIRRLITVESGLNDGIATPVVLLAIAGAASAEGLADAPGLEEALSELAVGVAVGAVVGLGGGWLLRLARRVGWAAEDFAGVAVLVLALGLYAGAVTFGGNGFVAAFCGGLGFGAAAGRRGPSELVFVEQASALASLLVWLAFGAVAFPVVAERADVATVLYAVLSLTVVRMVPVALAMVGTGATRETVLFVGWFGPRGLASLVFALLALEALGPEADAAVAVIAVTVLLSVVAHGATAAPFATRYAATMDAHGPEPGGPVPDMPVRGLPRAAAERREDVPDA